ncbi:MAG: response regulator [Candidatus Omnitrophota bacterium]
MFKRLSAAVILLTFTASSLLGPNAAYAQALFLPEPGTMVQASPSFEPLMIKGLTTHPENPLLFDFIMDTGNTGLQADMADPVLKAESEKLIKYFLASLAIPDQDQWVNLSPYEGNRILPDSLGKTELGRDMLAQDYVLKQVTSSFIYPEKELGKAFWAKVYERAQKEFGVTDIPMDVLNKVWITAESASVYVKGNNAFVSDSHLKVQLESDYLAMKQQAPAVQDERSSAISKQVIREIVLPELEKEVNAGQNFSPLRQIFHSMILAVWYKKNLKEALLSQVYADRAKTGGVEGAWTLAKGAEVDPEQIYAKYVQAFQKGVFNYIREDADQVTGEMIPRKYFSGGIHVPDVKVSGLPGESAQSTGRALRVKGEFRDASQGAKVPVISLGAPVEEATPGYFTVPITIPEGVDNANGRLNDLVKDLWSSYSRTRRNFYVTVNWTPGRNVLSIGENVPSGLNGSLVRWKEKQLADINTLLRQGREMLDAAQHDASQMIRSDDMITPDKDSALWLFGEDLGKVLQPVLTSLASKLEPIVRASSLNSLGLENYTAHGYFLKQLTSSHAGENISHMVRMVQMDHTIHNDVDGKAILKIFIAARYVWQKNYTTIDDRRIEVPDAVIGILIDYFNRQFEKDEDAVDRIVAAYHEAYDKRNQDIGYAVNYDDYKTGFAGMLADARNYYDWFAPFLDKEAKAALKAATAPVNTSAAKTALTVNTSVFGEGVNRNPAYASRMASLVESAFYLAPGTIEKSPVWLALTGQLPSTEWKSVRDQIFPKDKFKNADDAIALFAVFYGLMRMPNDESGAPLVEMFSSNFIPRIKGAIQRNDARITAVAAGPEESLKGRPQSVLDGIEAITFRDYYALAKSFGIEGWGSKAEAPVFVKKEAAAPVKVAEKEQFKLDLDSPLANFEKAMVNEKYFRVKPGKTPQQVFDLARQLAEQDKPVEFVGLNASFREEIKAAIPDASLSVFASFVACLAHIRADAKWAPTGLFMLIQPMRLGMYVKNGTDLPAIQAQGPKESAEEYKAREDELSAKNLILAVARPLFKSFDASEITTADVWTPGYLENELGRLYKGIASRIEDIGPDHLNGLEKEVDLDFLQTGWEAKVRGLSDRERDAKIVELTAVYGLLGDMLRDEIMANVPSRESLADSRHTAAVLAEDSNDSSESVAKPAILVVDDEEMLLMLSTVVLEDMYPGVPIIKARSGEQAKKLWDDGQHDFRLMVTDNDMEKKGAGLELIAYVRDKLDNKKVKILFNSGVLDEQKKQLAREKTAEPLAKPYRLDEFKNMVEGLKPDFTPVETTIQGGIDLNGQKMDLTTQGDAARLTFDPAMVAQFKRGDFTGLTPVILSVTPISSLPI